MTLGNATLVFLDANIIAKPVTRTLLMAGGVPSGFRSLWSEAAEKEAARHLRPRSVTPDSVRHRFGISLGPTGEIAGRFALTKGNDRQILADLDAARARFLVTEDVDDFAEADLISLGISAVNPDSFLAERLTREAYAFVIDLFVERQVAPPTTAAEFHSAIARQHPRLFAAHADLYKVGPATSIHREPGRIFRRCDLLFGIPPSVTSNPNRQKVTADQSAAIRGAASQLRAVVASMPLDVRRGSARASASSGIHAPSQQNVTLLSALHAGPPRRRSVSGISTRP